MTLRLSYKQYCAQHDVVDFAKLNSYEATISRSYVKYTLLRIRTLWIQCVGLSFSVHSCLKDICSQFRVFHYGHNRSDHSYLALELCL